MGFGSKNFLENTLRYRYFKYRKSVHHCTRLMSDLVLFWQVNSVGTNDRQAVISLLSPVVELLLFVNGEQSGIANFREGLPRIIMSAVMSYCSVNKKAVLSQRWPRNAPYIWVPWEFSGLPDYAHGYLFSKFYGRLFRWYHSRQRWWVSPPHILFLYHHSFARNFRLQFWVGVSNVKFWGRGGHGCWGWYRSKERWWVSIGRP